MKKNHPIILIVFIILTTLFVGCQRGEPAAVSATTISATTSTLATATDTKDLCSQNSTAMMSHTNTTNQSTATTVIEDFSKRSTSPTHSPKKKTSAASKLTTTKKGSIKMTDKVWTQTTNPVNYATASDTEAVANALIKYINQFRAQDGQAAATKVGGKLKQLADQRSVSISKNFCHDLQDEYRIATAIKFGEKSLRGSACGIPDTWVNEADLDVITDFIPAQSGEYRYEPAACTEAIGSDGPYYGNKTPDELGKELATGCRNSAGHWRYVGDGVTYPYISVGMTYSNGTWYAAVWVGSADLPKYN